MTDRMEMIAGFFELWDELSDEQFNEMMEKNVPRDVRQAFIDANEDEDTLMKGYICRILEERIPDNGS